MDDWYIFHRVCWVFYFSLDSQLVGNSNYFLIFIKVLFDESEWEDGNLHRWEKVFFYGQIHPRSLYFFLSQSLSMVSWPICLCASSSASSFSLSSVSTFFILGSVNTSLLFSKNSAFQVDIIVGCNQYFHASSVTVEVFESISSTIFTLYSDEYLFLVLVISL